MKFKLKPNDNKTNIFNKRQGSHIIPSNAYDICNYIAKYDMANFQIQAIMKLDGRLDYENLKKAVRLSIEAEPVLGCGFIKDGSPYWRRFDDINNINFCSLIETTDPDEAVKSFLESPLYMDNSPMFMVRLIRSSKPYDTLGFKINHVCSDAAGARDYIQLLSDIYSRIDSGEKGFVPHPSTRGSEDHKKLISALSMERPETAWSPQQTNAFPTWTFPWRNNKIGATSFAMSRLPYGYLDIMKSYAKARNATINDLILTAIFRAMFKLSRPPYGVPMDIPVTIDLRKYLPNHKAQAIRNFSSGMVIRMDRRPHESFEDTLQRIMVMTKDIKDKHPNIDNIRMADVIEKMNFPMICSYFRTMSQVIDYVSQNPFLVLQRGSPVLSNFGFVSKSPIKFGKNTVTDAYIVPPVVRSPGILLVASTYNGIISLGVGYYKPSARRSDMQGLLDKIRDELVEGCKELT